MIGDVIGEFKGQVTGVRVLSDDKFEASDSGTCQILGVNATFFDTVISKVVSGEIFLMKAKILCTTEENEALSGTFNGMAWSTGKGLEGKYKGIIFWKTNAQKLMRLNKILSMFDVEQDQEGKWTAKLYEIK